MVRDRGDIIRAALAICLSYVLALQLILTALLNGAQATQSTEAFSLASHALCLGETGGGDDEPSGSPPAGSHHYDLCCTLACGGVALFAPHIFTPVAYGAAVLVVVFSTADFGARPATAPPGLSQGPRAPPVDLV